MRYIPHAHSSRLTSSWDHLESLVFILSVFGRFLGADRFLNKWFQSEHEQSLSAVLNLQQLVAEVFHVLECMLVCQKMCVWWVTWVWMWAIIICRTSPEFLKRIQTRLYTVSVHWDEFSVLIRLKWSHCSWVQSHAIFQRVQEQLIIKNLVIKLCMLQHQLCRSVILITWGISLWH